MVEDAVKLAQLLGIDGLEPETAAQINQTIRDILRGYQTAIKAPAVPQQPVADIIHEWLNGRKEGD